MSTVTAPLSSTTSKLNQKDNLEKENNVGKKTLDMSTQKKPLQSKLTFTDGNIKIANNPKKRKGDENTAPVKQRRLDGIFEDPKPLRKKQKILISVAVQTETDLKAKESTQVGSERLSSTSSDDAAAKIVNMLTSDTAPIEYWQEIAEKRREALEDSLIENQKLDEENKSLREEVTHLKEENKLLDDMVQEAKGLAQLVESLTSEAENNETE